MKNETLIELQNRIYNQNKEIGWHDEPCSLNTFGCLFHSELSEAVEGLRKDLMDDHLPEHKMVWVEVGDFSIRVFDYLGSQMFDWNVGVFSTSNGLIIDDIAFLHGLTSNAIRHGGGEGTNNELACAVMLTFAMAKLHGVDLLQIINEKIEYNKHRADHKRENRAKDGGKKF